MNCLGLRTRLSPSWEGGEEDCKRRLCKLERLRVCKHAQGLGEDGLVQFQKPNRRCSGVTVYRGGCVCTPNFNVHAVNTVFASSIARRLGQNFPPPQQIWEMCTKKCADL